MRAYEFAKKVGATYAAVVKLAEANDVEVYSPLTQFEPDEVATLNEAFLKADRASIQAEAAQVVEKRRSKAAKALKARVAHDRQQFDELEAGRKRALAAAGLKDYAQPAAMKAPEMPVAAPEAASAPEASSAKKAEKPAAVKSLKDLVGSGDAEEKPQAPKISIEVSEPAEAAEAEDEVAPAASRSVDDDDDDDAMDYLHGKDRKQKPVGKAAKAQQQPKQQAAPAKPAPKAAKPAPAPVKPAPAKAPAKPAPAPSMRVGGTRAGFASVSMRTASAQAAVSVSVPKPVIQLSVSTREISIRGAVIVKELALKLGVRPNRLIADLMQLKVLASINQRVEPEVAIKVAQKYGYKVNVEHARDAANKKPVLKAIDADDEIPQDKPEDMKPRPPVVTFLGHVDHGKTTLMDYIRHTKVAAGEAGGITQAISAYQVDVNGRLITFLDTPGHSAFNAMRQRGAQLTDIAVIIIAADDGIMPQTQEAIKFARQAGVQIMVAITKCDKPTANTQRVKQMLQKEGLTPEEWGGDVVCCEVSGISGQGVDNLLEMILLQADVLELTANPRRRANGYVIEAELEQGFGPSAVLLVSGGTLKVGDAILIGEHFGKVRSLIDDHGRRIKEAPPATPVKCTGLSGVPEAGAEFRVMLDEKRARTLAEETARLRKEQELSTTKAVSLDALLSQMGEDGKRELSVVVKSDTQGSLEAITESLRQIKSEKVSLKIIGTGTGNVSMTDVKSAAAGKAVIVGFDIGCDSGVQGQARHDSVRISSFRIIYELIDFVKKCMLDLLPPEYTEKVKGHAEIKAVYDIGKVGKIAGSQMRDGTLISTARYRILRNGAKIWEGKLQSLKHFKDEVKEVTGQQECGVHFAGFEGFAAGDVIECYVLEELPRSL
ncbi:MAG: translation initiation factor IF-2 [Kiritimatiellae bacterium]|nr:translation initiation factor IF-2 [Kiritimatiellia bacterium]